MIEFRHVEKTYATGVTAIHDLNLFIEKGEFVFVLGPSGAGKSTFLKLMLREEKATKGEVIINGYELSKIREKDVPYMRRSLGVVFQDFRLISTMTAYENVAFAMRVTNIPEKTIVTRVPYVLSLVGLGEKLHSLPHELSGGEQQRVSLARALVHAPPIIIADEPTGNIDPGLSLEIMELLSAINSIGTTVVVVTHEEDLAVRFNKRIIRINSGRVVQDKLRPEKELPQNEEYAKTNADGIYNINWDEPGERPAAFEHAETGAKPRLQNANTAAGNGQSVPAVAGQTAAINTQSGTAAPVAVKPAETNGAVPAVSNGAVSTPQPLPANGESSSAVGAPYNTGNAALTAAQKAAAIAAAINFATRSAEADTAAAPTEGKTFYTAGAAGKEEGV